MFQVTQDYAPIAVNEHFTCALSSPVSPSRNATTSIELQFLQLKFISYIKFAVHLLDAMGIPLLCWLTGMEGRIGIAGGKNVGRMASCPLLAFVALMDVGGELGLGLCARELGCCRLRCWLLCR